MKVKASRVKSDEDQYGFKPFGKSKKRLNLNDLLQRAKDEEKNDKRFNLLIFSGAALVVIVFFLLLSL